MNVDDILNNTFEEYVQNDLKEYIENDLRIGRIVKECRKNVIDKFKDIEFVEEGHRYSIGDTTYISVSDIIKMYEPYVDWDEKARNYAKKNGMLKSDVQKQWRLNNLKATISGTRTHEFGESYTNLLCGHPELICPGNLKQYVKEYNTLIPTYPKEEAIKKFYDELENNLHPVGAEFMMSSKYIENSSPICGTCDLLFYDSKNDGFVIGDWKTNNSLIKEYARSHNIMMKDCVDYMVDEPISHYTIQFNIYQRMLESVGVKVIDRILIWLKPDGSYEKIHISKIPDDIIDKMMSRDR